MKKLKVIYTLDFQALEHINDILKASVDEENTATKVLSLYIQISLYYIQVDEFISMLREHKMFENPSIPHDVAKFLKTEKGKNY